MRIPLAICVLLLGAYAFPEDKGQCPGFLRPGKITSSDGKGVHPRKPQEPAQKPSEGAEYLGRITLLTAVSDKGYVCDAAIQIGIDSNVDDEVLHRFKERHFAPVEQNGKAVPANLIVPIDVWRKPDGKVVEFPSPKLPKL